MGVEFIENTGWGSWCYQYSRHLKRVYSELPFLNPDGKLLSYSVSESGGHRLRVEHASEDARPFKNVYVPLTWKWFIACREDGKCGAEGSPTHPEGFVLPPMKTFAEGKDETLRRYWFTDDGVHSYSLELEFPDAVGVGPIGEHYVLFAHGFAVVNPVWIDFEFEADGWSF